jgi:hypothetical protein
MHCGRRFRGYGRFGSRDFGVVVMRRKGESMLHPLALTSVALFAPALASTQTAKSRIEEATIEEALP